MIRIITIEEAERVINEWPDQDEYVNANYRMFLDRGGEANDNSCELAYYWSDCKRIIDTKITTNNQ